MKQVAVPLLLFLLMAGCKSAPPTKYYTLDMTPSGAIAPAVHLIVDRIVVGEALSRRDIMIKEGPTKIEYYATDQWAAGLDEMVRQKLEEEFGRAPSSQRTLVLTGEVLAFEQIDTPGGADAHVKLSVELRDEQTSRHDAPLLQKAYEARKKADTERPQDVVRALSQLVENIAAEIVKDAQALS